MEMKELSAIAIAIVTFALIVGVGTAILVKFASTATTTESNTTSEKGFINSSGYTLSHYDRDSFVPTITSIYNASGTAYPITTGNYTLIDNTIYNKTAFLWNNATINYTYTYRFKQDGYSTIINLKDNLGTNGLAGWVPALIAVILGTMILGYFGLKAGRIY